MVDAGQNIDLQVISFSDWHGQLDPAQTSGPLADGGTGNVDTGGASALSAYFSRERATQPNTLIVTGGDEFGATPPLAAFFNEEPAVQALNLMGLQANTFGNHNFDKGVAHLQSMIALQTYKNVSTNLNNLSGTLTGVSSPYELIDVGGVKVGLVGITNPDAPSLLAPGSLGSITVDDLATSATKANAARQAALDAGAHVVIALVHMGATLRQSDGGVSGPLLDFAALVSGFAVIVGDHTDLKFSSTVNGQLVVENSSKGLSYSRVTLTVHTGTKAVTNVAQTFVTPYVPNFFPDGGPAADPAVVAMLAPYRAQLSQVMDGKVALTTGTFARNGTLERTGSVPIGDLVADALRARYGSDIALTNGGGLRASIPSSYAVADAGAYVRANCSASTPCDVVRGDAFAVLPFGNVVVTRPVTGGQLWAAMEHGLALAPASSGRFPQISGFKVVYLQDAGVGSRVVSITLDDGGVVTRDAGTYSLATNDFTNAGGDGYTVLVDGQGTSREVMADVFVDHLRDAGTISPVDAGRISVRP